jgi:hypothetical protein
MTASVSISRSKHVYTCNLRVTSDALLRKDSQHPLWGLGLFFGLIAVFVAIRHWKGAPQG